MGLLSAVAAARFLAVAVASRAVAELLDYPFAGCVLILALGVAAALARRPRTHAWHHRAPAAVSARGSRRPTPVRHRRAGRTR
jgi:hypothetical protein